MIKLFAKIASVFLGFSSLFNACSNEYRAPVKKYMKHYLKEKTGKDFEEVEFYNTMSTGNSDMNKYYGSWRAVDDKRIEINMMAAIDFDTKEITPINPEAIDARIEKAMNCAKLSNQVEKLSRNHVTPVFVQVKGGGNFYRIRISVEDAINNELANKYFTKVKQITKDIRAQILQEPIYFEVDFYIFKNKFPFKKVIYSHGIHGSEPIGDFHINAASKIGSSLISKMGLSSGLDYELQQKVKQEAEDKFSISLEKEDVCRDLPPIKAERFLEDINGEGIREYTRYFVAIWDDAKKNVIDRKFARVNIFTKEIEWYEVKEFPRPLKE